MPRDAKKKDKLTSRSRNPLQEMEGRSHRGKGQTTPDKQESTYEAQSASPEQMSGREEHQRCEPDAKQGRHRTSKVNFSHRKPYGGKSGLQRSHFRSNYEGTTETENTDTIDTSHGEDWAEEAMDPVCRSLTGTPCLDTSSPRGKAATTKSKNSGKGKKKKRKSVRKVSREPECTLCTEGGSDRVAESQVTTENVSKIHKSKSRNPTHREQDQVSVAAESDVGDQSGCRCTDAKSSIKGKQLASDGNIQDRKDGREKESDRIDENGNEKEGRLRRWEGDENASFGGYYARKGKLMPDENGGGEVVEGILGGLGHTDPESGESLAAMTPAMVEQLVLDHIHNFHSSQMKEVIELQADKQSPDSEKALHHYLSHTVSLLQIKLSEIGHINRRTEDEMGEVERHQGEILGVWRQIAETRRARQQAEQDIEEARVQLNSHQLSCTMLEAERAALRLSVQEEHQRTQAAMQENQRLRSLLAVQQPQSESFLPPLPSSAPLCPQSRPTPPSASTALSLPALLPRPGPHGPQCSSPPRRPGRVQDSTALSPSCTPSPPCGRVQFPKTPSPTPSPGQRRRRRKYSSAGEGEAQIGHETETAVFSSSPESEQCSGIAAVHNEDEQVRQYVPTAETWLKAPCSEYDVTKDNHDVTMTSDDLENSSDSMQAPGFIWDPSSAVAEETPNREPCSVPGPSAYEEAEPIIVGYDMHTAEERERMWQDRRVTDDYAEPGTSAQGVSEYFHQCSDFDRPAAEILYSKRTLIDECLKRDEIRFREYQTSLEQETPLNDMGNCRVVGKNLCRRCEKNYKDNAKVKKGAHCSNHGSEPET